MADTNTDTSLDAVAGTDTGASTGADTGTQQGAGEVDPAVKLAELTASLEQERVAREAAQADLARITAEKAALETKAAEVKAKIDAAEAAVEAARGESATIKAKAAADLAAVQASQAELAQKVATYQAAETARLTAQKARNDERVQLLPEALRSLVPTELAEQPDVLAGWLDKAAKAGTFAVAAGAETSRHPRGQPETLTDEQARLASAHGFDPKNREDVANFRAAFLKGSKGQSNTQSEA